MVRNRATEKDIKTWLDANGWVASTAKFHEIELHAIRRPGWKQIFRFHCDVKSRNNQSWVRLWGAVWDDETQLKSLSRTKVVVFEDEAARGDQLAKWSEELHGPDGKQANANWGAVALIIAVCLVMLGAFSLARLVWE
jgi:hypothetical protein